MSTYILIHGAWHGAWCWRNVTPLLEQARHVVITPDLPGSDLDLIPLAAVTFASYVQCVLDVIDGLPAEEPLILVGHGLAGMVISQVAEARAERIGLLVYLSALLPRSGETAMQMIGREANPRLRACLDVDDVSVRVLPDRVGEILYQDCHWWDIHDALQHLTPQALLPLNESVTLTNRFLGVPRIYISCRYDLVISPKLQSQMYSTTPCERVVWLMTGHDPFLSAPDRLATRLLSMARLAQRTEGKHA